MPRAIFEGMLDHALSKMVRPPTKSMLGTKMRTSMPIQTVKEVLQACLSTEAGLPATDVANGIMRSEDGTLLPVKTTATSAKLPHPEES